MPGASIHGFPMLLETEPKGGRHILLPRTYLVIALCSVSFWTGSLAQQQALTPSRTLLLAAPTPIDVFYMRWDSFLSPCDEKVLSCKVWDVLVPYFKRGPDCGILVLQRPTAPSIRVKPVRSGLYFLEQCDSLEGQQETCKPTPFIKLADIAHSERFGVLYTRLMEPSRIFPLSERTCQLPHFQTECLRLGIRLPSRGQIQQSLLDHIDGVMIPSLLTKYGRGYLLASDVDRESESYNNAFGRAVEQSLPPVGILRYTNGRVHLLRPPNTP